ncbi:MAG: acetyltransferase/hydrolase [Candidatus Contendobacter odensis]|uniref:Acetyltransferase/hydrolase n=1 Tax=Candidatus Contendibacter odensensis TaxID=1400860 RepID=A0A2G6PEY9_9GAMM|nr:MAG: acetyltransferase/hydrolase [Candidatus Contendobacter odensis]
MMTDQQETVVLVHGLYVHGMWMRLLEYWLQESGYKTVNYSYPTMTRSLAENADDLEALVERLDTPTVHFLGHSMGGLVVRYLFRDYPTQRSGRVVTMGTPHQGSYAAQFMYRHGLGVFVGRALEEGLLGDMPAWVASNQLGSIAGTLNIGLGLILPAMPVPADGVIAVVETRFSGMSDHICLPVSHMQMLVDPVAIQQACTFFATGRFLHSSHHAQA